MGPLLLTMVDFMLALVLTFAHILFAAGWFGATLFLAGDVRRTLELGKPHTDVLHTRLARYSTAAAITGWLTLIFGVALILAAGGFGAVSPAIHLSLVLVVLLLGVGILMGRTARAITATVAGGGEPDQGLVKRLAALSGIFQLGWAVVLALMVFRNVLF